MRHEYARTLAYARDYRNMGLAPLPSRMDSKRPMLAKFGQYRTEPVPPEVYSEDQWLTTNVQLMTGVNTSGAFKIVVVDLDGPGAVSAWKQIAREHDFSHSGTWIVETGGGGKHIYFSLPWETNRCPTRTIWTDGQKHSAIEILGDGRLVVAPPSRHVVTGREYRWLGRHHPGVSRAPARAPAWLLAYPAAIEPTAIAPAASRSRLRKSPSLPSDSTRDRILQAIGRDEKLRLARSWGLRVVGPPDSRRDWLLCRALDREDINPSGTYFPDTGVFHDHATGQNLSFFDIGVALNVFSDWKHAVHVLNAYASSGTASEKKIS